MRAPASSKADSAESRPDQPSSSAPAVDPPKTETAPPEKEVEIINTAIDTEKVFGPALPGEGEAAPLSTAPLGNSAVSIGKPQVSKSADPSEQPVITIEPVSRTSTVKAEASDPSLVEARFEATPGRPILNVLPLAGEQRRGEQSSFQPALTSEQEAGEQPNQEPVLTSEQPDFKPIIVSEDGRPLTDAEIEQIAAETTAELHRLRERANPQPALTSEQVISEPVLTIKKLVSRSPKTTGEQPAKKPVLTSEQKAKVIPIKPLTSEHKKPPSRKSKPKKTDALDKLLTSEHETGEQAGESLKNLLPKSTGGWWDVEPQGRGFTIKFRWRAGGKIQTQPFPRVSRRQFQILKGSEHDRARQFISEHIAGHLEDLQFDPARKDRACVAATRLNLRLGGYQDAHQAN